MAKISAKWEMDRVVQEYWHLVDITVTREQPRLSLSDREEVKGAGYLALVQAAQSYDVARGASFQTHAIKRIQWATRQAGLQCEAGAFGHRSMEKWADLALVPFCVAL